MALLHPLSKQEASHSTGLFDDTLWRWPCSDGQVRLGSLLPVGFESYVRVLHPCHPSLPARRDWEGLAERAGVTLDPISRWDDLVARALTRGYGDPGSPALGELEVTEFQALQQLVQRSGEDNRNDVFGAFWSGYGFFDDGQREMATDIGSRDYVIFRGHATDMQELTVGNGIWHSPNYWWAANRSWCVVTDMDMDSTFVGARNVTVDRVIASGVFEVLHVDSSTVISK